MFDFNCPSMLDAPASPARARAAAHKLTSMSSHDVRSETVDGAPTASRRTPPPSGRATLRGVNIPLHRSFVSRLAPFIFLGCSASTSGPPGAARDGGVGTDAPVTGEIEWVTQGGSNEDVAHIVVGATYVAWTAKESTVVSQPSAGSVRVWPKSGGVPRTVWAGPGELNAIATDDAYVYWQLQYDARENLAAVYRAKLPDGTPEVIADVAYGSGPLVIDATRVFYRSGANGFSVLAKTGGAAPRAYGNEIPFGLEPFDETVFMIGWDTLRVFDLATGAAETVSTLYGSAGLVRLGGSIYFLDAPSGEKSRVVSYEPATKKSSVLFTLQDSGKAIVTDGRDLFITTAQTDSATVFRHRPGDASPTAIASGVVPWALAVDDRYVYVAQRTTIGRFDKNR